MDAFDFDNVKLEKAKAVLRYRRLRNMAKLFRLFEICIVLVSLSWISTRLPFAVRISGEYLRHLISFLISPNFIFLLSNVIVITLLAKSGLFSGQSPAINNAETNIYDELIKHSENRFNFNFRLEISPAEPKPESETEEIVYQDKQIVSEVQIGDEITTVANARTFGRSQSEKLKKETTEKACGKLQRSETEKCRKAVSSGKSRAEAACFVEKLSSEEFQRTIEDFIAKQVRFHQEEKMSIVLQNHS